MNLEIFKDRLLNLQPSLSDLLSEGYSQYGALDILNNEYILKPKEVQNHYDSLLLDFINNYDLQFFRVRNIFFDDILRYLKGYLLIAGIDGGYLGLDESTGYIYIIYADEIDNINTLFVENEEQFFEILLIFAEYSSIGSEDEIEKYLERCENVCLLGSYDYFF
ncbi:hypothetical protein HYN56_15100 [Flavobacterium crocinum]|uniref:SMI1/KNR4 family protein n=1 Tax=Flavobacterium crocinum TaxID=2183896 RepID=A0A2S1YNA8_9FLAO|nr:hypothetical protein [Flavobacterium crocinum]AWK05492.1 hypothetical protein HYN56_15100 [Flavobacterium crocinum]